MLNVTVASSLRARGELAVTKIQALCIMEDEPSTITVHSQEVTVSDEFAFSTQQTQSSHAAMPSLVRLCRT